MEREFVRAAIDLDWAHESSTPGVHENNAVAERYVRFVIHKTRSALSQASFPPGMFESAAPHRAFMNNSREREFTSGEIKSPYKARFGVDFPGPKIPYGSLVDFMPSPTVVGQKMESSAKFLSLIHI